MTNLQDNLPRLSAIAIFCMIIAGLWLLVANPFFQKNTALDEKITAAHLERARLEEAISNLTSKLASMDTTDAQGEIWLAKQAGEMTARIQARLGNLARQHGISLRSVTPAKAAQLPHVDTTALRIEAEADLEKLRDFIVAIEHHSPALFIERATLRRLNRPDRSSEQPLIFFQLDISAPIKIDGAR